MSTTESTSSRVAFESRPQHELVATEEILHGPIKEDWHAGRCEERREIRRHRKLTKEREHKHKHYKMRKQSGEAVLTDNSTIETDIPEVVSLAAGFTDFLKGTPDFWEAVRKYDVFKHDSILSYVEGISQLLVILTRCDDTPSCVAGILLYLKTLVKDNKSLLFTLNEYLEHLFMAPQTSDTDNTFIAALRECRTNWKLFKNNKLFKKVSSLLTLIVSVGLCEATSLEFSIGKMKVIEASTLQVQMNAFDVCDALFDTVAFFIEGGYRCYQAGSLKPLLYDDYRVFAIEEEYLVLCRMWDLQQNGNLLKMEGIQASEFDNRLEKCISSLKDLIPVFTGLDKKLVTDKYNKLLAIKSDYIVTRLAGGSRRAPFTIEFFGKSNQGKTTIGETLVDRLLLSANLPLDRTRRATLNASSKFMDTWKTDHLVAVLDDMCNEKSNFVEKPPTRWVIDLCNNQTFYAPKAEIEAKGKVFVEPEIVVINTNKKDLDAYAYSNCPYSVQRRAHLVVTVRAKTQFQAIYGGVECGLSTDLVNKYYETHDRPPVDDLWDLDVEVAIEPTKLSESAKYTPFYYNSKEMTGIGINEFLEMCIDLFDRHRTNQQQIVARYSEDKDLRMCGVNGCKNVHGQCSRHSDYVSLPSKKAGEDEVIEEVKVQRPTFWRRVSPPTRRGKAPRMKKQWGEGVASVVYNTKERLFTSLDSDAKKLDDMATKGAYLALSAFTKEWDWLLLVPAPAYEWSWTRKIVLHFASKQTTEMARKSLRATMVLAIILTVFLYCISPDASFVLIPLLWMFVVSSVKGIYTRTEEIAYNRVREKSRIMVPMLEKFKNENYKQILALSGTVVAFMALRQVYKAYMCIKPKQGNIVSPTSTDVEKRDKEVNPYVAVVKRPLPIVGRGRTVTAEDMSAILDKNLLYGVVEKPDKKLFLNVLMLKTNYMLLPKHYLVDDRFRMTLYRNNPDSLGGHYNCWIDKHTAYQFPHQDLAIVYVNEGGSYKDISDLFLNDMVRDHAFYLKYRQQDGEFVKTTGSAKYNDKCNNGDIFAGVEYFNLGIETFGGLCGAVLYSAGTGCNITGIHVGGTAGKTIGCAGAITTGDIKQAIESLSKKIVCINTASDTNFREKQLGVTFLVEEPLHPKSGLNYLNKDAALIYSGSCKGQTTSHSDVKQTPISAIVAEECGVANKWMAPKMKPEWWGWQKCLSNMSVPGESMPAELLEYCAIDYLEPLQAILKGNNAWKTMRPLTDEENLLGVPGKKFLDAINKSTSIGYPLSGPKSAYMIELEPTETYPHNFKLTDDIISEITEVEALYAQKLRAYPIAKACKKDEVLDKEKCRIFYGNSIALTWLIRKYYLPLIRFLQMHPLLSECAVGINCHSREWDQLYKHITKFSKLVGGDYKKYDQKLSAQLIIIAFRILIALAELCAYDPQDLIIMESMVADIVYAYINFNGDLVQILNGTHISGNSLTVIVNGICGALNLRAAYYSNNPREKKYRDNVAISTYGDDNLGSCSENCKFSIKIISEFLAKYGQEYTMPNKNQELSDFLEPCDFEFLKRKTVYIEEIDCHVGALSVDSIYKSLHMFLRGKSNVYSESEACAINIDTAVREFFNHGRKEYEEQRARLRRVAIRAGIVGFCTELDSTFDDRVQIWFRSYEPHNASSDMTLKDPPRMTHGAGEVVEDVPQKLDTTLFENVNSPSVGVSAE